MEIFNLRDRDLKREGLFVGEGRLTVEVMQAAHISALERRPVKLPLTGKDLEFDVKRTVPFPSRV